MLSPSPRSVPLSAAEAGQRGSTSAAASAGAAASTSVAAPLALRASRPGAPARWACQRPDLRRPAATTRARYYVLLPAVRPVVLRDDVYYPVEAATGARRDRRRAPRRAPSCRSSASACSRAARPSSRRPASRSTTRRTSACSRRFRLTPGLLIEGELGKTSYDVNGNDNVRVDRRLGGSLVYEIGAYNSWRRTCSPASASSRPTSTATYSTTQDFGEIGIGLRWAVTPKFHLAADIRAGSRATVSTTSMPVAAADTSPRTITPPTAGQRRERGVHARAPLGDPLLLEAIASARDEAAGSSPAVSFSATLLRDGSRGRLRFAVEQRHVTARDGTRIGYQVRGGSGAVRRPRERPRRHVPRVPLPL